MDEKKSDGFDLAKRIASYALVLSVGYGFGHHSGMKDQYDLNTNECKAFVEQKINDLKYDFQKELDKRVVDMNKDRKIGMMDTIEQKAGTLYRALFP